MQNRKKMQASTLILVIFLTLAVAVTGIIVAVNMANSSKGEKAKTTGGTDLSGTPTPVSEGGIGDGFTVNAAYDYECSGPLFAYSKTRDALLAYCYADSTAHTPYNLTENADITGKVNEFYFPEFDLTVYYRLDTDTNIWRIYKVDPESKEALLAASPGEYIVYNDAEDILTYAPHLHRFNADAKLTAPRYRDEKADLFFQAVAVANDQNKDGIIDFYTSGGVELTIDMDGDGYDELFTVVRKGLGYKVKINGVDILGEKNLIFTGVDVIDIDSEDTYREIVCNYKDEFDFVVKSIVIRFVDGAVNTFEAFRILEVKGDGKIQFISNDIFLDTQAIYEYSVSQQFTITTPDKKYDTNRDVTAIKDVGVKFIADGVSTEGVLEAGTEINIYQVDYISKAYFRTTDGREGILAVDGKNVGLDPIYFYRCFEDFAS